MKNSEDQTKKSIEEFIKKAKAMDLDTIQTYGLIYRSIDIFISVFGVLLLLLVLYYPLLVVIVPVFVIVYIMANLGVIVSLLGDICSNLAKIKRLENSGK